MIPPREYIDIEATDAERRYNIEVWDTESSVAAALRQRAARAETRAAILRSRMTADEIAHNKAVEAGHPSAAQGRHLTVVEGGSALPGRVGSVSPQRGRSPDVRNSRPPSTPSTPFDTPSTLPELETHVTGIGRAAARLAALVARRDRGRT